jgi:hypothetical protein
MTAASHEPPDQASAGPTASETEHAAPAASETEHATPASSERYGPLLLERYRKADGRPLLLYRRVADDG